MGQLVARGRLLPTPCPLAAPIWLIPMAGGVQQGTCRSLRASALVAQATLLSSACRYTEGVFPPSPPHGAVSALLSRWHQQQSWGYPAPAQGSFPPPLPWHLQCPQLGHVVEAGHRDGSDIVVIQGPAGRQRGAGQSSQAINGSKRWSSWHQTPGSNRTHPPPGTGWMDGETRDRDSPNTQQGLLPFPGFSPRVRIRLWSTALQHRYQTPAQPLLGARER